MASVREDVLRGFQAAQRMHQRVGGREKYLRSGAGIDVYQIAADLDIPVMFQDLDGLLGAYFADPVPGILLTRKRTTAVQRFTCAHELGHFYLKHEESLDPESQIGFALSGMQVANGQERQADAFAFSFLMPRWLLTQNLQALMESGLRIDAPSDLHKALLVYQLSLRVGCSYSATTTTLHHYRLLPTVSANALRNIQPRAIKQHLVSGFKVPDWHRDVWLITATDNGAEIDASPDDLFVVRIREPSTAGYRTKLDELEQNGFEVLREGYTTALDPADPAAAVVGSFPTHETVTLHSAPGHAPLKMVHARPWEPPAKAHLALHVDVDIKIPPQGLSQEERRSLLSAMVSND